MHDNITEAPERPDYMRPLKARWWLIAIIGLVAAAGTYKYYAGKPTSYQAQASLYMVPSSALGTSSNGASNTPVSLADQALLIPTRGVAVAAARELGFRGDPSALLGGVSASNATGTDFIDVTATAPNAVDAGRLANAFAEGYISTQEASSQATVSTTIKQLQQRLTQIPQDATHADQRTQLAAQIAQLQLYLSTPTAPAKLVQPAGPGAPLASSPTSHAIYGLVLGLLIGAAIAFAVDALSRRLKRIEEIEPLYGAPVIAKIPTAPHRVSAADPRRGLQAPIDEAFRTLRTTLELRASNLAGVRTIMVASAAPGDGKSTVARNLALAYVEAGMSVVIVDCDLRRPAVSRAFSVDPKPGLPEVLSGSAMTADALRRVEIEGDAARVVARARELNGAGLTDDGSVELVEGTIMSRISLSSATVSRAELSVMPSASPSWNPAAIFAGGRFEAVLSGLRGQHDVVILDTSPLAAVSDAATLLPLVDGVLLVSRLKRTPTGAISELMSVLAAAPTANVLGVVANDVASHGGRYSYSRGYGEGY